MLPHHLLCALHWRCTFDFPLARDIQYFKCTVNKKASHNIACEWRTGMGLSIEACGRGEKFLLGNLLVKRFYTRCDFTANNVYINFFVLFDEKWLLIVWLGWVAISRLYNYVQGGRGYTLNAFTISIKYCSHLFILMASAIESQLVYTVVVNIWNWWQYVGISHLSMQWPRAILVFHGFWYSVEMCVKLYGNCLVHLSAPSEFVPSMRVNDFGMNLSHNCEAKSAISLKVFSHDAEIESE